MSELLKCPFCGGEAQVRYYEDDCCHWAYTVYCKDWKCSSNGTPSESEEKAIAAWNRRYEAEPKGCEGCQYKNPFYWYREDYPCFKCRRINLAPDNYEKEAE